MTLTASRYIKAFLMKLLVILINVIVCQYLEDLKNSVNQLCFKLPMYDVTKSGMRGRAPHSKRRQTNFNVIAYEKFVGMISDSTLAVTFKKSQLLKF